MYVIKTSIEDENKMLAYLARQKDNIGKVDNCATRTLSALAAAGYDAYSLYEGVATPAATGQVAAALVYQTGGQVISLPQGSGSAIINQFLPFNSTAGGGVGGPLPR